MSLGSVITQDPWQSCGSRRRQCEHLITWESHRTLYKLWRRTQPRSSRSCGRLSVRLLSDSRQPLEAAKGRGSISTNRFYSTDLSKCFQERHGVGQETQESHLRSRSCCEEVWGSTYAPSPVPLTEQAWSSWGRVGASVTLWTQLRILHHRSGKEKPSSLWVTAGQYSGYRSWENPATSEGSGLWEGPTSRPRYMVLPTATAQPEQKGMLLGPGSNCRIPRISSLPVGERPWRGTFPEAGFQRKIIKKHVEKKTMVTSPTTSTGQHKGIWSLRCSERDNYKPKHNQVQVYDWTDLITLSKAKQNRRQPHFQA